MSVSVSSTVAQSHSRASTASVSLPPSASPSTSFPSVGLSWSLLNVNLSDGPAVDDWMIATGEHFIMKADLQICSDRRLDGVVKNRTVTLTEESWIETKMVNPTEIPHLPPPGSPAIVLPLREKKHTSLLEIHSVEIDPSDPSGFMIHFFSGSASSKAKAGLSKMKRFLQVSSSFEDFLKYKYVRCHSGEEAWQWKFVLDKLIRNIWQRKLEETFLPNNSTEFYKRHAFVIKKHQDRLILLSNEWFYNVEVSYKPIAVKGMKWAIPVSSFSSVSQLNSSSSSTDLAVMMISFDASEAKKQFDSHHRNNKQKDLVNKHHEFIFRTRDERQRFVDSLAAVYWQVTRRKLTTPIIQQNH